VIPERMIAPLFGGRTPKMHVKLVSAHPMKEYRGRDI